MVQHWDALLRHDKEFAWVTSSPAWTDSRTILMEDEQGLGFLMLTPQDWKRDVDIVFAYTLPSHRRRGVMTALLERLKKTYASIALAMVDEAEEDPRTIWFWEARGFRYSPVLHHYTEKAMWTLTNECDDMLNEPYYFIIDDDTGLAYPVNHFHDKLGHVPGHMHPINYRRVRDHMIGVNDQALEEAVQSFVQKCPEVASSYPPLSELVHTRARDGFLRPYQDDYYPRGRCQYLYAGNEYDAVLGNTETDYGPWTSDECRQAYSEKVNVVNAVYNIQAQW